MWNWCWSLSRRRAHAVHLHAERPALHRVATRWVLTTIPSRGGKISGLSQAQPWHHGLYRSQVWTHTEAQYGYHHVTPCISYSMQIRLHIQVWQTYSQGCLFMLPGYYQSNFIKPHSHSADNVLLMLYIRNHVFRKCHFSLLSLTTFFNTTRLES